MRRIAKIDGNQNEVVNALRRCGLSVYITSMVGRGFADIVVGKAGKNYLFEIKDPSKPPSARKLTEDEEKFKLSWSGQISTITTWEEAMTIMSNN